MNLNTSFKIFFLFISSSFILTSCSSVKRASHRIEDNLESSSVFRQSFAGLAVYDPVEHKMIFEHNADKYFTPASNTKLFSFYTGLQVLGDSIPALHYTIAHDSLIFKGTGDPSFLYADVAKSATYEFLADNDYKLFYYSPEFTEKFFGPGWAWDDYSDYYSAERTNFPVYGNRVHFKFKKGDPKPVVSPKIFEDSLVFSANGKPTLQRAIASNSFNYSNPDNANDFEKEVPFKYSPEIIANILQDTLHKKVTTIYKLPKDIQLDRTYYSLPADSIYKHMLEVSDNFIAEQILFMASDKIADTLKTAIAINYMKKNYLQDLPDEPVWVDGSGLSRYNLFTPRTMVKILEKIKNEVPYQKLFHLMPNGGKSGTLKNYYKAEEPYIFAKTGTLSNNHSLSGFLKTRSGKILIFSFMNSNYTIPTSSLKDGMETILKTIRDNY